MPYSFLIFLCSFTLPLLCVCLIYGPTCWDKFLLCMKTHLAKKKKKKSDTNTAAAEHLSNVLMSVFLCSLYLFHQQAMHENTTARQPRVAWHIFRGPQCISVNRFNFLQSVYEQIKQKKAMCKHTEALLMWQMSTFLTSETLTTPSPPAAVRDHWGRQRLDF